MIAQRDIVLLSFPFSDLSTEKVRPAVVISSNRYNRSVGDVIVVPMTSNLKLRDYAILLTNKDLETGRLVMDSVIKADRVLSVHTSLIRMTIGKVNKHIHDQILDMLWSLLKQ